MEKIKNKNLIKSILVTLSLVLTFSFGLVLFKDNVNVVKADSVEVELDSQVNKVTSSSTRPNIDDSYFDYTNSSFFNKFDMFITSGVYGYTGSFLTNIDLVDEVSYNATYNIRFYYKYNNSINSYGDDLNIGIFSKSWGIYETNNVICLNFNLPNASRISYLANYPFYVIVADNGAGQFYTFGSPTLYNCYLTYNNYSGEYDIGYNAGIQAVTNSPNTYNLYTKEQYDNNYTNGVNHVLGNLTDYNLYTKEQYDNNYTNGYNTGYNAGLTGSDNYNLGYNAGIQAVTNSPNTYNLYTKEQYDNNYTLGYNNGYTAGYDIAKNDFTGLGIFSYATYYNYAKGVGSNSNYLVSSGRLNSTNVTYYNGGFYNDKTLKTELESYLNNNSDNYNGGILSLVFDSPISTTRYYNFVTRGFEFGNSIDFYFDDDSTLNFSRADSFNTDAISLQNLNKNIVKIDLVFANSDYLVVGLSANTLVEDSYNTGYNDGKNSVDTTIYYNNGYNTGYNNGKNDGIKSANKYSFLSLIGSVVDAPIQAFTGLFNFDLLGFNMLNFIKALFTLTVIIVVARFILAKM